MAVVLNFITEHRVKKGFCEVLFVAAPKVLGGVCTIVVNVALLRYFGPEEFGVYSFCIIGIALADATLGSAIDMAVLRLCPVYLANDAEHSMSIEKVAFSLKLIGILGLSLLALIFRDQINSRVFVRQSSTSLVLIGCSAATAILIMRSVLVHLQVQRKFAHYGLLELLHQIIKFCGIAAILMSFRPKPESVLFLFALAPASVFIIWAGVFGKRLVSRGTVNSQAARELLSYAKWFLLTFGFAAIIGRLDVVLLTIWSGLAEAGIFSAGQAFALIPQVVGSYLAIVISPRVMPYYKEGRFLAFFSRFQLASFVSCAAIYLVVLLSVGALAPLVLPATFARSSDVFVMLLPGTLASLATFPLVITFVMFVRPKFLFTMDWVSLPFMILLYYPAIRRYGATGAAAVTSAFSLIKAALALFVAWRCATNRDESPRQSVIKQGELRMSDGCVET